MREEKAGREKKTRVPKRKESKGKRDGSLRTGEEGKNSEWKEVEKGLRKKAGGVIGGGR